MSSHGNMRRTQFDQKSPRPPEEGVSRRHRHIDIHTDIHTDGHRNSMDESAQWADSVKYILCPFHFRKGPVGDVLDLLVIYS